jgi:hypothetical protein
MLAAHFANGKGKGQSRMDLIRESSDLSDFQCVVRSLESLLIGLASVSEGR